MLTGGRGSRATLTRLRAARLGSQIGQVHVGLPAVDDGVGVLARPLRRPPVHHGHLWITTVGAHKRVTLVRINVWVSLEELGG